MMEWTDTNYRTLARLISKHAWLYTEMLAAETIVYQKENLVSFFVECQYSKIVRVVSIHWESAMEDTNVLIWSRY